ncbi:hypothetical protein [Paludisphaera rhizosphaerae]|uniref:hypothetical protein n=1 Tax=Paludisphaera rhizosphaerae TaxID=2711216 RepID=UPI0013ED6852|nr:hypothetical protein [Paludisphaera rhizosphaerae]
MRPAVERLEVRDVPYASSLLTGSASLANLLASTRSSTSAVPTADTTDVGQPTARELARQAFSAKFSGSYVAGPGRYTNQKAQFFIAGGGMSTSFLKGDVQIGLFTPVDSSQPTTGIAALIDKNASNSGNILVLNLQGDTSTLDSAGRPTHFNWTVDGSSGGTFSGATGSGTLDIRYWAGGKRLANAPRSGKAGVMFKGLVDTNGVTNILRVF